MTVYWEYAFAENFLLDGLLLFLSVRCAGEKPNGLRLSFAAACGGGEALLFPLLRLPLWCALAVKLLLGTLLVVLALKKPTKRTFFTALAAFFALTFGLGGAIFALDGIFGLSAAGGRVPLIAIVCTAAAFAFAVAKGARALYRSAGLRRALYDCRVTANGRSYRWRGLADSGNRLFFRGRPVCVIPPSAALALFRGMQPIGRMRIDTVGGSRESPVFAGVGLELSDPPATFSDVCFTVGEVRSKEYTVILHTAYTEGRDENSGLVKNMAEKVRGK